MSTFIIVVAIVTVLPATLNPQQQKRGVVFQTRGHILTFMPEFCGSAVALARTHLATRPDQYFSWIGRTVFTTKHPCIMLDLWSCTSVTSKHLWWQESP